MISLQHVSRHYSIPNIQTSLQAVNDVSLHINEGEFHGIIGLSGAGKSTLLRMMNLLERPDKGKVIVDGRDLTLMTSKELREVRRSIGVIFQHFNLLSNRTISGNVSIPLELAGVPKKDRVKQIEECLQRVGLADKADQYPAQLSGGQKQRVAIARAIVNRPQVLLCDEPTSSLDPQTTFEILDMLKRINKDMGVTIVIVTHEMNVANHCCNKVTVMENGQRITTLVADESGYIPIAKLSAIFQPARDAYV